MGEVAKIFLPMRLFVCVIRTKTILPDACGADKVKFDVETKKGLPGPVPPAEGKAQIIFIETVINTGFLFGGPGYTTRFGLDGAWVGAAKNNSYFTMDIAPGKHHLCSSVQADGNAPKDMIGLTSFTAEAGKVYYLSYVIKNKQTVHGGSVNGITSTGGIVNGSASTRQVDSAEGLVFLDEDEGPYRVKASKPGQFVIRP